MEQALVKKERSGPKGSLFFCICGIILADQKPTMNTQYIALIAVAVILLIAFFIHTVRYHQRRFKSDCLKDLMRIHKDCFSDYGIPDLVNAYRKASQILQSYPEFRKETVRWETPDSMREAFEKAGEKAIENAFRIESKMRNMPIEEYKNGSRKMTNPTIVFIEGVRDQQKKFRQLFEQHQTAVGGSTRPKFA